MVFCQYVGTLLIRRFKMTGIPQDKWGIHANGNVQTVYTIICER